LNFYQFFLIYFGNAKNSENLFERAIGMLNAGMTMNAVAMNIECSTHAIRHLRQRFHATGRTGNLETHAQDRYIRNINIRNRFQTATTTIAITSVTHNYRIFAQTVRKY
jgi:hypothetical protein